VEHRISFKVYYEDTDSLGVVYHANYLKYLERARTERLDASGKPIRHWNQEGFNFAVYKLEVTFLKPARLGDVCEVVTTPQGGSEYRQTLKQVILPPGRGHHRSRRAPGVSRREDAAAEFPPGV